MITRYFTFKEGQRNDVFVDRGGDGKDVVIQLGHDGVMGVCGGSEKDAMALAHDLVGRSFKHMHESLPTFIETNRVLYVFSRCKVCGKVLLGNSEYCSTTCYEQ